MRKKLERLLSVLVVLCLVLSIAPMAVALDDEITVASIEKYGNLDLSITGAEFEAMGFTYGDIVTVGINGKEYDMPVGGNYSDVDTGSMICRVTESCVIIAINMGDFATTTGLATKVTNEDKTYTWTYNEGVVDPVVVTITMKEAGGYLAEYLLRQLTRTNEREDYGELNDSQFANFRNVATSGMGTATLYRSSSPINPELNRNNYADAAMRGAAVKTVMNLADDEDTAKSYEGFNESYYGQQNVIYLNMGVDFTAESFRSALAEGLRFFAANDGPYLVHCNEGKDRAGFVSAILECLMGATAEEVIADYMVTYYNYYGVEEGSEQYDAIGNSNIRKSLATAFGVSDITAEDVDLAAEAEEYLAEIGLTDAEISALKENLGADNGIYVLKDGTDLTKYGHIDVDISTADFVSRFDYGDIVTVTVNGYTFDAPVCTDYTDVKSGAALVRAATGKTYIILAINYGQISVEAGVAHADGTGYALNEDLIFPMAVTFELKEMAGYLGQWQSHHLERSNEREDYPDLTDAEFANFRAVSTSNILENTLYRSTSPISDELGRNTYSDAAAKDAGVKTFINLSDSEEVAKAYSGYEGSYYSTQNVIYLDMPVSFTSDAFKAGLAEGYRYMAANEGPYLIHCLEGKDRTGMAIAILELFAGATLDEMLDDYMVTYYNFYGVTEADSAYDVILEDNIVANLQIMLDIEDLYAEELDLQQEANDYLLEIGLTEDEIAALKVRLCGESEPESEMDYSDVAEDDWFYEDVAYAWNKGLMLGVSETEFSPNTNMTRAQTVLVLYRLAGEPAVEAENVFTDLTDNWYRDAVIWAYGNGITKGTSETTFSPDAPATRAELVTFLYRYAGLAGFDASAGVELDQFTDGSAVPGWAEEAIQWSVAEGVIKGAPVAGSDKNAICPNDNATRAECAAILHRFVENVKKG